MPNVITNPPAEAVIAAVRTDDRTVGGLPLPHFDNSTGPDLQRLRATIIMVDTMLRAAVTTAAVQSLVDQKVAALVAAAPGTLDTLDELAAALGDDPNFATTITNALALKASASSVSALSDRVAVVEDQGYAFTNRLHFGGL